MRAKESKRSRARARARALNYDQNNLIAVWDGTMMMAHRVREKQFSSRMQYWKIDWRNTKRWRAWCEARGDGASTDSGIDRPRNVPWLHLSPRTPSHNIAYYPSAISRHPCIPADRPARPLLQNPRYVNVLGTAWRKLATCLTSRGPCGYFLFLETATCLNFTYFFYSVQRAWPLFPRTSMCCSLKFKTISSYDRTRKQPVRTRPIVRSLLWRHFDSIEGVNVVSTCRYDPTFDGCVWEYAINAYTIRILTVFAEQIGPLMTGT